ncbi:alpha/beta hydrolase fold protein [Tanacetum coccineum]
MSLVLKAYDMALDDGAVLALQQNEACHLLGVLPTERLMDRQNNISSNWIHEMYYGPCSALEKAQACGNAVVLYASSHHDIPIVVNVSGRYKMDRGIEERLGKDYFERAKRDGHIEIKSKKGKVLFRATEESKLERLNTNMHEARLKTDKDCKVLTIHGSEDEVSIEDAFGVPKSNKS